MKEEEILKNLIIITSNKKEKEAIEISKNVIFKYDDIFKYILADDEDVLSEKMLPLSTRKVILNMNKLYKNYLYNRCFKEKVKISSYSDLVEYLKYDTYSLEREVFKILYFNTKNILIKCENIFYGTIDTTTVYIREVVKNALKYNCKSVILVHNHPSGDPSPSKSDDEITMEFKKIFKYFEIRLSDHIIITRDSYYSYLENYKL